MSNWLRQNFNQLQESYAFTDERPHLLFILSALQTTAGKEQILGIGAPAIGFHKRIWDAALLMAKLKLLHIQVSQHIKC